MSAADKLAQVLAEHDCYRWQVDLDGPADAIVCDCGTVIPEQDAGYAESWYRAHVAAVVLAHLTAEGWAQGREEFATKDGEDEGVTEIEPPTREWAERVAATDNAYLRRTGFEPNITVVRRRVTDWEPVDA